MNDAAKLWVEALRSGKFAQAHRALRRDDARDTPHYCCLGVACELYRQAHPDISRWEAVPDHNRGAMAFVTRDEDAPLNTLTSTTFLPPAVKNWLGLTSDNGEFSHCRGVDRSQTSLTRLNDSGHEFPYIADVIESAPELFKESA